MSLLTTTTLTMNNTHTLQNEEIHQIIDSHHQLLYYSWCNKTLDKI